MAALTGHTGPVRDAAFTADGSIVVTISADNQLITWDISQLVTINTSPGFRACQAAQRAFDQREWRDSGVPPEFDYIDNCR
jgi:WD40 repeat protein